MNLPGQGAPDNPYRWQDMSSYSSMQDPWAEDRAKAPGFTVADIDQLMRQAYAQGVIAGHQKGSERQGDVYDEGWAAGRSLGRAEVVEALGRYETNAIFNVLLTRVDQRRTAAATKREKENLKWVGDQIAKVADALDGIRENAKKAAA